MILSDSCALYTTPSCLGTPLYQKNTRWLNLLHAKHKQVHVPSVPDLSWGITLCADIGRYLQQCSLRSLLNELGEPCYNTDNCMLASLLVIFLCFNLLWWPDKMWQERPWVCVQRTALGFVSAFRRRRVRSAFVVGVSTADDLLQVVICVEFGRKQEARL